MPRILKSRLLYSIIDEISKFSNCCHGYLYIGVPALSMYQRMRTGLSLASWLVTSHGRRALSCSTADVAVLTATEKKNKYYYWEDKYIFLGCTCDWVNKLEYPQNSKFLLHNTFSIATNWSFNQLMRLNNFKPMHYRYIWPIMILIGVGVFSES